MARTRTLAARSWRRQATWPTCADLIKAVVPLLSAACTLACAFRQDSVSGAPPHRRPLETAPSPWRAYTHTHTHTPAKARSSRATDECARSSSRVLAPSTRTRPHPAALPPSAVLPGGAALRAAAAPLRAAGALRPLRRRAAGAVCCPHCPIASFEHARPACSSQRSGSTSLWKQLTQLAQGQGGRASSVKAYEKPAAVNPTSVTGISRRRKNRKFLPPRPRPASPVQPGNGKRKKNGLCAHAGAA